MTTEVELKLSVPEAALGVIRRHPSLRELSAGPVVVRRLYSVYFDTPEFDLWRHDTALRLRRVGRNWLQCVKFGGSVAAGLHQRGEIEAPVARAQLDFTKLIDPALGGLFAEERLRSALAQAFVTDFRRLTRNLVFPDGSAVEFALDCGAVVAGSHRESLCEVELELKSGSVGNLFDLAHRLVDDAGLRLQNVSKAGRGYRLLTGAAGPTRASAARMGAGATAGVVCTAVLGSCLEHLQANEAGMLSGADPEYLHQMRVALRRLRSAFVVFEPMLVSTAIPPLVEGAQLLSRALAPARDWDVFVNELLPPVAAGFPGWPGLARIARTAAAKRRAANGKARAAVGAQTYQHWLLDMGAWLSAGAPSGTDAGKSAQAVATGILRERLERVRRRGRHLAQLDEAQLHRLRIAAKRLRYAVEFFAPLYARKPVREFGNRIAALQDVLGRINDARASRALVAEFDARSESAAEAGGIIVGWYGALAAADAARLDEAWRRFRRAREFW